MIFELSCSICWCPCGWLGPVVVDGYGVSMPGCICVSWGGYETLLELEKGLGYPVCLLFVNWAPALIMILYTPAQNRRWIVIPHRSPAAGWSAPRRQPPGQPIRAGYFLSGDISVMVWFGVVCVLEIHYPGDTPPLLPRLPILLLPTHPPPAFSPP